MASRSSGHLPARGMIWRGPGAMSAAGAAGRRGRKFPCSSPRPWAESGMNTPTRSLLMYGFLIAADSRLTIAMGKSWWIALIASLVVEAVYVAGLYVLLEVYGHRPVCIATTGRASCGDWSGPGAWTWGRRNLGWITASAGLRPQGFSPTLGSMGARVIAYAGEAFLAVISCTNDRFCHRLLCGTWPDASPPQVRCDQL